MLAATLILLTQLHGAAPAAPGAEPPLLSASVVGDVLDVSISGPEGDPVELWDGDRLVAVLPAGSEPARLQTNAMPTSGHLVARRGGQTSRPVDLGSPSGEGRGAVMVTIPPGSLTVTSAGVPSGRGEQQVTVTDTRAGALGFVVQVRVDRPAALAAARAEQVPGNALRAQDVILRAQPTRPRPGRLASVARLPAGHGIGSVRIAVTVRGAAHPERVRVIWTVL